MSPQHVSSPDYILNTVVTVLIVFFILFVSKIVKKDLHSHWSSLLPNFKYSTKDFYELIQKEMESHEIKDLKFEGVALKSGSVLSHKRAYLRIYWQEYYYDLCFAPFGDGCFVSWWLIFETGAGEEFIGRIPFIGSWLRRVFYLKTFYQIDTASMWMTYSHKCV